MRGVILCHRPLRLLLIEDEPDHAALIRRHLAGANDSQVTMEWVDRLAAGLARLEQGGIDAVLLDLRLPDSDTPQTLPRVVSQMPHVPIVVLTAFDDMDLAMQEARQGAQDYLVKSEITGALLLRSVRYAMERMQSQTALQRYAAELERSNQELDQFAHVVSHDLKAPLSVINCACEILQRKYADHQTPESAELLAHSGAAAQRMGALIDDLLQYASVGGRHNPFDTTACDAALDEALANLQPQIAASGATVTRDALPTVVGDKAQLAELFQNLIGNAIKYRSDAPPLIHISAQRTTNEWLFCVRDNGIGIEPQQADRVFVLFQRLATSQIPGTGIGLAVCKKIVQRHGGRIWVESAGQTGSTFYFTIPPQLPSVS